MDRLMRYKISWVDRVGFYTHIEAASKEEALEKFNNGEVDSMESNDFCETDYDSIEVEEDN